MTFSALPFRRFLALVAVIAGGIVLRRYGPAHGCRRFMIRLGAGALWAAAIYFVVALLLRSRPRKQIFIVAAALCAAHRIVQAEPYAGARHFPAHAGRRLGAGPHFSPGPISLAYAAGLTCRARARRASGATVGFRNPFAQDITRHGGADFWFSARPGGRPSLAAGARRRASARPRRGGAIFIQHGREILEQSGLDLRLAFEPAERQPGRLDGRKRLAARLAAQIAVKRGALAGSAPVACALSTQGLRHHKVLACAQEPSKITTPLTPASARS